MTADHTRGRSSVLSKNINMSNVRLVPTSDITRKNGIKAIILRTSAS